MSCAMRTNFRLPGVSWSRRTSVAGVANAPRRQAPAAAPILFVMALLRFSMGIGEYAVLSDLCDPLHVRCTVVRQQARRVLVDVQGTRENVRAFEATVDDSRQTWRFEAQRQ